MKLLVATGLYPPDIGGPATYAQMLEEELPKYAICLEIVPFGKVRQYPKGVRHLLYLWKLWRSSRDVDVVYALDPISVGLPALIVAGLIQKPFLLRLGGDYAWEQGRLRFGLKQTLDEYLIDPKRAPLAVRLLAWLQKYVATQARQVVVPSQYLKQAVIKWGVPENKIIVIYSAFQAPVVPTKREELRSQFSYTWPTIISAGRLVPWKGFGTLLEVVCELQKDYPDLTLVIAGDGENRAELETQAARLGFQARVRFTGRVTKDALGAAIKAADVFVLNTAYEGLAHQLIEVMNLDTPIVTTTAGGNPELLTDGISGLLVPYNNIPELKRAIKQILDQPEMTKRLVQAAQVRAKDFTPTVVMKEVQSLLLKITNGKNN